MALAIRLARGGMKKRPHYRIVVTDSRQPRDGRFIEKLGTYNPLLPKDSAERVKLDGERAAHWLSVGAQPSDRVARFLDAMGIRTRAAKSNLKKGEPGANAKERIEVKATKATEREEAAAALAAAPAPEPEVETVDVEATPEAEAAPEVETVAEVEAAPEVEPAAVEAAPEAAAETETVAETAVEGDAPAGEAVEAEVAPEAASDLEAATETDASPAGPAV